MMVTSDLLPKGDKGNSDERFSSSVGEADPSSSMAEAGPSFSAGKAGPSSSKRRQSPRLSNKKENEAPESKATSTPRKRQRRSSQSSEVTPRRSSRIAVVLHVKEQQATAGVVKKRGPGRPPKVKKLEEYVPQHEWEVEKIVESQIDALTQEHFYRVKWKGYSAKLNTWEPKKNLSHCRKAIQDFEKALKRKKKK
jgi:hypothetical protein